MKLKKWIILLGFLTIVLPLNSCSTLGKIETNIVTTPENLRIIEPTQSQPSEKLVELQPQTPVVPEVKKEEVKPEATPASQLRSIYFDFNKYTLRSEGIEIIKENAKWMEQNPSIDIDIQGYTDERGPKSYNLKLGENRSISVKKLLISLGINKDRLHIKSLGPSNTICKEHNKNCWKENRRVDFVIVTHPVKYIPKKTIIQHIPKENDYITGEAVVEKPNELTKEEKTEVKPPLPEPVKPLTIIAEIWPYFLLIIIVFCLIVLMFLFALYKLKLLPKEFQGYLDDKFKKKST